MKKINQKEEKAEETDEVVIEEVDDEIPIGDKHAMNYWWAFGKRTDRNVIKWLYTMRNKEKADLLIGMCKRIGYQEIERKTEKKETFKIIDGIKRKFIYDNYTVILEKIPAIAS
jgi:hypothetical protein